MPFGLFFTSPLENQEKRRTAVKNRRFEECSFVCNMYQIIINKFRKYWFVKGTSRCSCPARGKHKETDNYIFTTIYSKAMYIQTAFPRFLTLSEKCKPLRYCETWLYTADPTRSSCHSSTDTLLILTLCRIFFLLLDRKSQYRAATFLMTNLLLLWEWWWYWRPERVQPENMKVYLINSLCVCD